MEWWVKLGHTEHIEYQSIRDNKHYIYSNIDYTKFNIVFQGKRLTVTTFYNFYNF